MQIPRFIPATEMIHLNFQELAHSVSKIKLEMTNEWRTGGLISRSGPRTIYKTRGVSFNYAKNAAAAHLPHKYTGGVALYGLRGKCACGPFAFEINASKRGQAGLLK